MSTFGMMGMGNQFQNVDLLKALMGGNKRGTSAGSHPESIARTPTPGTNEGSLEFPGFGPSPCLDLKPIAATEAGATNTQSCASSPAPPPYQFQTSSLPPSALPTGSDCPRYSTLHGIPHASQNTGLPIYEIYSGSQPSTSSCGHASSQQLREGLVALFQAPKSFDFKYRRPSTTTTASTDPALTDGRTPEIWSTVDEPSRVTHSNNTTLPPVMNRTISASMVELDGTEPVFMPAELDGMESLSTVAELSTGAEEPKTKGKLPREKDEEEPIDAETKVTCNPSDLPVLDSTAEGNVGPDHAGMFKGSAAHTDWLRISSILQPRTS